MSVASSPLKVDRHASAIRSSQRAARVLRWSLRVFGSIDLVAIIAVVVPAEWLKAGHSLCGLGEFPDGPLPLYLARSTSMLYAFHGAVLWFLSTHVRRYCPLIRFMGAATVAFGAALVFIDLGAGLPIWWTWSEGPAFAVSGLWLIGWTTRLSCSEINATDE